MESATYFERVEQAAAEVRRRAAGAVPEVAIVLGSGLGDFAGQLKDAVSIPYGEIPNWPAAKVIGTRTAGDWQMGERAARRSSAARTLARASSNGRSHASDRPPRVKALIPPTPPAEHVTLTPGC